MMTPEEIAAAIAQKVGEGNYRLTTHAETERENDQVSIAQMAAPEILEQYPNDPRGHSCLALGFAAGGRPIHVVAGQLRGEDPLVIITVYHPDPNKWVDWRKRK